MEHNKNERILFADFLARFNKRTGVRKDAIFGGRKALMEEIYATGDPIYCDQSYYAHFDHLYPVRKEGEHFVCDGYTAFEDWRDCHCYTEYEDADGNKAWLMTGGRYD